LVAGATGYLGKHILKELKNQGYRVRALARNPQKLEDVKEFIDDMFIGEVTRPETLDQVCEDIDIVISSLGITRQKDGMTYMDVDYQANQNLLELARRESVSKFIYVSVLNAHQMMDLKIIQAKERFVDNLVVSGLNYSVIRPSGFFSDMLEFLTMAKKGRVSLFGSGDSKINPIHGADLAEVCVQSIVKPETEINVGGPEVLTYKNIADLAFKAVHKKPKISKLPDWVIRMALPVLRMITSAKIYGPLEFLMTVTTMDNVGDTFGKQRLIDFYIKNS